MSKNTITQSKMMEVLDWSYEKAVNGLPGMETAQELANNYLNRYNSADEAIDKQVVF